MSYHSPIDIILKEMNLRMEGEVCKAVQNVGVNVDKNELMKALQYDRGQYEKGYADRDAEIIRCKNCKFMYEDDVFQCAIKDGYFPVHEEWFCADGERRE